MAQGNRSQAVVMVLALLALLGVMWQLFGALTREDPERVGRLLGMVEDADPSVRLGAVTGLAGVATDEALAAMQGRLGDSDVRVRVTAAWALWRSGREDLAKSAFEEMLSRSDSEERMAAVTALRGLESQDTSTLLRKALGDRSAGVRTEAALGLVRINDEAGLEALGTALGDIRPDHSVAAARALARVDDPRAVKLAERLTESGKGLAPALAEAVLVRWGVRGGSELKAIPAGLGAGGAEGAERSRVTLCEALGHLLTKDELGVVTAGLLAEGAATPAGVRDACEGALRRAASSRR